MPNLPIGTFILTSLLLFGGCRSGKTSSIDFPDGSYHGEIDKNGKKSGKGIYKWHDGSTYEGDFEEDLRHGNGHFSSGPMESYKGITFVTKEPGMAFTIGRTDRPTKVLF